MFRGKEIETILADLDKINQKISAIEKKTIDQEDFKNKIQLLSEQMDEIITSSLKDLRIEISEKMREENKVLLVKLDNNETKMDEISNTLNSFEDSFGVEKEKLEQKNQEIKELSNQVVEKEVEIREIKKQIEGKKNSIEEYKQKLESLEDEMEEIRSDNNMLSTNNEEYKSLLEDLQAKNKELIKEKSELRDQLNEIGEVQDTSESLDPLLKILLESSDQGRIYLALNQSKNRQLLLNELTTELKLSAVEVKQAVTFLHEIGVVIFEPSERRVSLAE